MGIAMSMLTVIARTIAMLSTDLMPLRSGLRRQDTNMARSKRFAENNQNTPKEKPRRFHAGVSELAFRSV